MFTRNKEDAKQFYENFRKMQKEKSDKVFFETIAESARNPRFQKILYEQRMKKYHVVKDYLEIQIENGFFRKDIDIESISGGFVALSDGLTLNKLLWIDEDYNKKT